MFHAGKTRDLAYDVEGDLGIITFSHLDGLLISLPGLALQRISNSFKTSILWLEANFSD